MKTTITALMLALLTCDASASSKTLMQRLRERELARKELSIELRHKLERTYQGRTLLERLREIQRERIQELNTEIMLDEVDAI